MISNAPRYNNNNAQALDNSQLMRLAPSIFATEAHESRGERYAFIPTIAVVEAMRNEGFYPVSACQSTARDVTKKAHTKHMIRFRQHDGFTSVGEVLPEVVMLNSHDGTSSYQLNSGLYRLVCMNGMIVADSEIDSIRVRHSGNVIDNVIEGSFSIVNEAPKVAAKVEDMRALSLSHDERIIFAEAAKTLRWDESQEVNTESLLYSHRQADKGADLWRTLNVVQEKIIRGGAVITNTEKRTRRARAVNSVSENSRLNKALWTLAEEMRKLKA
jgi:hypothetical protein